MGRCATGVNHLTFSVAKVLQNLLLFISNPQNIYTCCIPCQMGAEVLKNSKICTN